MKITKGILGLVLLSVVFVGCSRKAVLGTKNSERTGWAYNKPKKGYFNVKTDYDGKIPPGMVYISTGSYVKGQNEDPVSSQQDARKRRVSVDGFFMDEFEITNINWREYVAWLQGVYRHDPKKYLAALPDETVWREELAYNDPLVNTYYTHVSYGYYPVVGVSWEQAMEYCTWRTDRINERILIDRKIIEFQDLETVNANIQNAEEGEYGKYIFTSAKKFSYLREQTGDEEVADLDGIIFDASFRLPTETEWEYAAYGAIPRNDNYSVGQTYPWQGYQMREMENKKLRGQFIANFKRGRGDLTGENDNHSRTVSVDYYPPNEYGLYNMAGNVNEWVLDVYRSTSNEMVGEISPFRGNDWVSDSAYAEGILDRMPPMEQEVRDSMRNYLVNDKKFYQVGRDVRDFKDGDKLSSINDSILNFENASPIEQATMISKTARVYKGGSWQDKAIWLNPSRRRWLDQKAKANDIGFRCAMSAVGGKKNRVNN
ncbi:MAG: formylglycine-generating enzyme family protein [Flavobacteriaceae bacterium]|jgi:gliding motility-associated lipoprotein GldJ|nr:formylglycine-generating enzyme family protein [Flavobacteriaceae bacterium]